MKHNKIRRISFEDRGSRNHRTLQTKSSSPTRDDTIGGQKEVATTILKEQKRDIKVIGRHRHHQHLPKCSIRELKSQ